MFYFLLLFIGVPLVELYFLIKVGGMIGALPTVALVIATAFLGVALIRKQGMGMMLSARSRLETGTLPAQEIFEGILLAFAGLCLLTPGFVTDALGFMLLVPPLRKQLFTLILLKILQQRGMHIYSSAQTHSSTHGHASQPNKIVVDGHVEKTEKE